MSDTPRADYKSLGEAILATLENATEGAWQWGEAGGRNFVAFDGSDIVGVATFRAKSDAMLAGLLQQNAKTIAEALMSFSDGAKSCEWSLQDEDGAVWNSGCSEEFWADGDCPEPREWMKFCPYCGGKAVFELIPEATK